MTKKMNPIIEMQKRRIKHYKNRLNKIALILEQHDNELLASDGPVPQEPLFMRRIYKLAKLSK